MGRALYTPKDSKDQELYKLVSDFLRVRPNYNIVEVDYYPIVLIPIPPKLVQQKKNLKAKRAA